MTLNVPAQLLPLVILTGEVVITIVGRLNLTVYSILHTASLRSDVSQTPGSGSDREKGNEKV